MNLPRTSFRKIGLTCDFFRFEPQESRIRNFQNQNLKWLFNILNRKDLLQHSKVKVTLIHAPEDSKSFKSLVGNKEIFKEYAADPLNAWAKFYDCENVDLFPRLFEKLAEQDLIVGFEIPPTVKRFLQSKGKPYLNLHIHPLRFLRDLCFGATTNSPFIARCLEAIELNPLEIETQRSRFAALFSRSDLPVFAIPSVPVLIGQTEHDSVLLENGRFVEWSDYEDELAEQLEKYNEIIYLEHPYQGRNTAVQYLRNRHHKTVISTNANSYGILFSNHNVPRILTLSSSLGVEASVIGHKCQFLLADPRKKMIVEGIDLPMSPTLGHKVLGRVFWQGILEGDVAEMSSRASVIDEFDLGEHYLRNSLESWAYRSLQYGLQLGPIRKTIFPAITATTVKLANICAALVGQDNNFSNITSDEALSIGKRNGIELQLMQLPLIIGERRSVPLLSPFDGQYLIKGFHQSEGWGVWSSEYHSQLLLPIAEDAVRLSITMKLKVFDGILDKSPILSLVVQSNLLGHVFFRSSSQNEQRISFSVEATAPFCCIDFYLSDLGIPALCKMSNDQRTMGFGLSELEVVVSPSTEDHANEQSTSCTLWGIVHNRPVECDSALIPTATENNHAQK